MLQTAPLAMNSSKEDDTFFDLPPATHAQRKHGWTRDYAGVWVEHDDALKDLTEDPSSEKLNAFLCAPNRNINGHTMRQFDFTGGERVRKAKTRARNEEIAFEEASLRAWRAKHA